MEADRESKVENRTRLLWRKRLAALWRLFREHAPALRGKFSAAVALSVAGAVLPLTFVFVIALLADRGSATLVGGLVGWAAGYSSDALAVFLGSVALVLIVGWAFEVIWFADIADEVSSEVHKSLFSSLLSQPISSYQGKGPGLVAEEYSGDLNLLRCGWGQFLRRTLKCAGLVVTAMIAMFWVEPRLSGIAVGALLVVVVLAGWLLARPLKMAAEKNNESADGVGAAEVFGETLAGLRAVKSFAMENHQRGRLRHALVGERKLEKQWFQWRLGVICGAATAVLALLIFMIWDRARAIEDGSFEMGRTVTFALLLVMLAASVVNGVAAFCSLSAAGAAAVRVREMIFRSPERLETGKHLPDSRGRLEGGIEFSGVSAQLPHGSDVGSRPFAGGSLHEVTFSVKAGHRLALVGAAESGRELVADLLLALHQPQAGDIRMDGRSVDDYPLAWLRGQIGWVPRHPHLFGGSVAENLAHARPSASEEEVRAAAEKAGALAFIEQLNDGFATQIAVTGRRHGNADPAADSGAAAFHPSERQMHQIALARVFLKDPPIVVIEGWQSEHADSAADDSTKAGGAYSAIAEAEDRLAEGRTAVLLAARLSATRDADEILVLRDGRIEDRGDHANLYEARGYYRLLCESSFGRH